MSFKTPFLCDRRVFDKKGKWKSPKQDIADNIFYFVKEPLTLQTTYVNGREEIKETMTIVVFGAKPIIAYDEITLHDGKVMVVSPNGLTYNEFENNILVKDMLKPRYTSIEVMLE